MKDINWSVASNVMSVVIAASVVLGYFHSNFQRLENRQERVVNEWREETRCFHQEIKDLHGRTCRLEEKYLIFLGVDTKEG